MKKLIIFAVLIALCTVKAFASAQSSTTQDSSYITIPTCSRNSEGGVILFMCMKCQPYFAHWDKYTWDVRVSEDSLQMDDPNVPKLHPISSSIIPGEDGGQVINLITDLWSKYKVLFVQVSIKENQTNTVKVSSDIVRMK